MHLLLIVILGVIIANWLIYGRSGNSTGCGCLIVILTVLLIGILAGH